MEAAADSGDRRTMATVTDSPSSAGSIRFTRIKVSSTVRSANFQLQRPAVHVSNLTVSHLNHSEEKGDLKWQTDLDTQLENCR